MHSKTVHLTAWIRATQLVVVAIAATLVAAGSGCTAVDPASATPEVEIEQFLTEMAIAKDAALLSGDVSAYAPFFASSAWPSTDPRLNEDDPAFLAHMRDRMIEQGSDVLAVTSTVEVIRVTTEAEDFVVRYMVRTTLRFSVGGQAHPEPAESVADLRAVLRRDGDTFVVRSLELDNDAPGDTDGAPVSEVPGPSELGIEPGTAGEVVGPPRPEPLTYYSSSAAAYADRYWHSYNPAYRRFTADCTNFASQCLSAGGRGYIYGWYQSDSAWWYSTTSWPPPTQSYTWAGARNLFANLVASYSGFSVASSAIRAGDLIFADWEADGVIDHTMIVVGRACSYASWSCVLIDQHIEDHWHWPLSATLAVEPRARFYPVRPVF